MAVGRSARVGRGQGTAPSGGRAPLSAESPRLFSVAAPTDRLQVRVLERGPTGRDLHDMVDVELARPTSDAAEPAGVAVAEHHVRAGRVPEVVPMELPPATSGTVGAPVGGERPPALHASTRPSRLAAAPLAVSEPGCGEREDPAVRTDLHGPGSRAHNPAGFPRLKSVRLHWRRPTTSRGHVRAAPMTR